VPLDVKTAIAAKIASERAEGHFTADELEGQGIETATFGFAGRANLTLFA